MNKKVGLTKPLDWEFHHAERTYLENRISLIETEVNWQTRHKKLQHLTDLKKAYCTCETHQEDRVLNLLYQLELHNTSESRKLIHKILQKEPQGFSAVVSSCQQIIGTSNTCELILYEVTSSKDGTFEAVKQASRKQPHPTVKDVFFDFVGTSFTYVCSHKGEEYTISNLFSEVKGLPMVVNATDGLEGFFEDGNVEEESEVSYNTPSGIVEDSLPELVSNHSNSFLNELN